MKTPTLLYTFAPSVCGFRPSFGLLNRLGLLCLLTCLAAPPLSRSATIVYNGLPNGTSTNWSDSGSWTNLTAPGGSDDVKFYDSGAVTAISNINNFVDGSFPGFIGSLQYGNTNNNHTTLIAPGQTLSVTNTGGLIVGTLTDNGAAQLVNATVTGAGGTLSVSNSAAVVYVSQGKNANVSGTRRATLDLSGLDTFLVTASRVEVGTREPGGANNVQNATGTLLLARTNILSLGYAPSSYTSTANQTNALGVGENDGNAGGVNFLYLGQTNAFFLDALTVGKTKTTSTMLFNPGLANPVAYFRGTGGPGSRVSFWSIGDMQSTGSSSSFALGTNDFSGGTIDALVNTMSLARDRSGGNTGTTATRGILTFTAGTIDVNTLLVGNQAFSTTSNTNPMVGVFNVNGAGATLVVNTSLVLGNTTVSSVAATNTSGTLNVINGTVRANAINVGAVSANNIINFSNATLVLSNTLATPAKALTTFNLTNSTLQLNVGLVTNIVVTNLVAGGVTNIVNPASIPVFTSYPVQLVLVKYYGAAIGGVGYNFGFGATALPSSAPGAYLSNNVANHSIDLYLPYDPRPIITSEPSSYSGSPGDTVNFAVGIDPNSVTPLSYQWYLGAIPLTNGPTGNGSTLAGAQTDTLTLTGAQPADNGNYTVLITNLYGAATSAPPAVLTISSGCVGPSVTGPGNQTVIQGNNATFSAGISGNPVPALQWQRAGTDIPGATLNSLTVTNTQYPADDQVMFSIIATNSCGSVTNSATLTVIVPPTISAQPASLIVTNTQSASFTVAASGVPPVAYQWSKNGSPISSGVNSTATNATLTIASAIATDIGTYSCTITNQAGATNSANATLTVNSVVLTAASLTPFNGQTNVAYDTPLHITFSQVPTLRAAGKIQIFNVTNSAAPADTLDLSQGTLQPRFVGAETFNTYPVIITGNQAAIYPHAGILTSNQTYFVTVDDGVFADSTGAYFAGIAGSNTWQFSTKPAVPANSTNLFVAQDYSGDFATVQGALDSLPANNNIPTLINIRDGFYTEIVNFHFKSNIVLRGQSRSGTRIGYANNSTLNASTHFRMAVKVNANDIAFDNLTLTNMTAQDLSQAEALMIESGAQRIIVNNCDLDSYQDTILANISTSKAYLNRSLIQGDVDFIWGGGNLFFTNCEIRWLIRAGNGGALGPNPSPGATDISSNGFSFVQCALTTLPGANPGDVVGRTRGITNGNTALIGCFVSTNIGGWAADALPTNNFRNWYYGCTNDLGASVTLSNGILLLPGDPNIALASSAISWLYGWSPALSPNILTQPVSQTVIAGQAASLTVTATGIPDPAYQWLRHGTNLSGATTASLSIPAVQTSDADTYAVVVSNASGSVTSALAVLVVDQPPVAANMNAFTIQNQSLVLDTTKLLSLCTDPDGDPLSVISAGPLSTNGGSASLGGTNITYLPATNFLGADLFNYTISDGRGGTATGSVFVTVGPTNSPAPNIASGPDILFNGHFHVGFAGIPGYPYTVQVSSNVNGPWTPFTNLTAGSNGLFDLEDPTQPAPPSRYYRTAYP